MKKKPKLPAYTRARIIACKGRCITLHENPQSRWTLTFVPEWDKQCREMGLSVSGEVREGFRWQWHGGNALTIAKEKEVEDMFLRPLSFPP